MGRLRELAGPYDSEIAYEQRSCRVSRCLLLGVTACWGAVCRRVLAPASLRATFGLNRVRNGVHVTDVDVDGPLECKFVFHVVAGAVAT